VDYILAAISIALIIRGFLKGFIHEIAGILSLLVGFFIAYSYANELAAYLSGLIATEQAALIMSYVVLFLVPLLIINYLAKLTTSFFKAISLNFVNRVLGGFLGLLKSLLIILALWYLLDLLTRSTNVKMAPVVAESQILHTVGSLMENIW
jgi:membrane protein required for colicin V production